MADDRELPPGLIAVIVVLFLLSCVVAEAYLSH